MSDRSRRKKMGGVTRKGERVVEKLRDVSVCLAFRGGGGVAEKCRSPVFLKKNTAFHCTVSDGPR